MNRKIALHNRGVSLEVRPANWLDLVGVTEIAERAGTSVGMIQSWRKRHADFPAPFKELAAGPVWDWEDVEDWIDRPRKIGRPRQDV